MGVLGDLIDGAENLGQSAVNWGTGTVEDIVSFGKGLINEVGANVTALFGDDVIGINANKVDDMIGSIESYIKKVNDHLDKIKADATTNKAMQGEYAAAIKTYVEKACEICYRITSRLRYFEDKLVAVRDAYKKKDEKIKSTVERQTKEMDSKWQEYKRQS